MKPKKTLWTKTTWNIDGLPSEIKNIRPFENRKTNFQN
jgi:hypothetical protein